MAEETARAADWKAFASRAAVEYLETDGTSGLIVGVLGPEGRWIRGFGKVRIQSEWQPPAGNTLFEIGSITKTFTGTLLADMVQSGKVRVDDSAQQYLPPAWRLPQRGDHQITLLHLATHTSSLPVQPPAIGLFALATKDLANPYAEYGAKPLAATLGKLRLSRPVGSHFEYSNLGVGLLGHALADAADAESFERLLYERMLKPLQLSDTRITLSAGQQRRLARGHDHRGKPTSPWTFATLGAAGALRSTMDDMLSYAAAALDRKAALSSAFALAQRQWHAIGPRDEGVGLCWFRRRLDGGGLLLWHNGGTGGYRSFLGLLPEGKRAVVVLSSSAHSVDELALAVAERLAELD